MGDILWKFGLAVKRLKGKDEFEIYKNYIQDLPSQRIAFFMHLMFEQCHLKQKNNAEASGIRIQGNNAYRSKDYQESLRLYTKSLRYANYNSAEYAVALANRSAVHFAMENYKTCLDDINLCLDSNYPKHLKPKVYIRKAQCFQNLGEATDMRTTLVYLLNYLDDNTASLKPAAVEKYKKKVKDLITSPAEKKCDPEDNFEILPPLVANPTFLSASSSVMLQYSQQRGYHVVAKEEIAQGDVLFVEKAYAFVPDGDYDHPKEYYPLHCQYCLLKVTSCVPCKKCVKHLYCNEQCRDAAWKEFHQWECFGIQGSFFKIINKGYLALRIIIKAIQAGILSTDTINFEDALTSYGNKDNNYPFVYNLPSNFHRIQKSDLMDNVAIAALVVTYLKTKTNFFEWMKQMPAYANQSYKKLMIKLGGLIIRHCNQFLRNVIPVRVFDNEPIPNVIAIASTFCPSMAMMDHSCIPNTAYYFVGNTAVVKATRNIRSNEGVSCSLAGINFMMMDKDDRKALLQKFYYMKCTCQLCCDPRKDTSDAYFCVKCKGPALPLEVDYLFARKPCACVICNYKFKLSRDTVVREQLAFAFLFRFNDTEDIDDANRCLEISKTIFQPNHTVFEVLYNALLNYHRSEGEAKCFIKIGKIYVDYYKNKYFEFAIGLALQQYIICVHLVKILQNTAAKFNAKDLGEVLDDLTNFLENTKLAFSFHYPQFFVQLQKVEKSIIKLRILHTIQIANKEVLHK